MKRLLILFLLPFGAAAHAQTWMIAKGSTLGFDTSFEGAPLHGGFKRFSGRISLDKQHPQACRFDVSIKLASVHTGNPTGDKQLQGTDFFDVAAHPEAHYRATHCRWNGKGPIEVQGTLTLRGVKKPVSLTAKLEAGDVLTATATVNRLHFGVGQGQWSSGSVISPEVKIKAHLKLAKASH
ncbi:YceI family protein [Acidihalobacter prosperus]